MNADPCNHYGRLWAVSPGLRLEVTFTFCHDCGEHFDGKALEALVKERYPDVPFTTNPLDVGAIYPDGLVGGWQMATRTKWVCFLYPGELVGVLTDKLKPVSGEIPYLIDYLPPLES